MGQAIMVLSKTEGELIKEGEILLPESLVLCDFWKRAQANRTLVLEGRYFEWRVNSDNVTELLYGTIEHQYPNVCNNCTLMAEGYASCNYYHSGRYMKSFVLPRGTIWYEGR